MLRRPLSHCHGNHPKMTVDPHSLSTCLSAVSPLAPPGPKWQAFHRMSWPTRPLSWMKPLTTISVSAPRTNMESVPLWRLSRLSSPRASLVSVFRNVFTTFSCAVYWCMGAAMFGLGWVSLVMYQIVSHFLTWLFSWMYCWTKLKDLFNPSFKAIHYLMLCIRKLVTV